MSPTEWDETAHLFDGVCQEQMHVFASERWPGMNIDCLHFKMNDHLVAGCLVMHRAAPLGLGGLAVCKWGPILLDASAPNAQQLFGDVVDMLIDHYAVERRLMLSMLPRPQPAEENSAVEHLRERGFKEGAGLPFPNRYFVNVQLSDEDMRASFGQKWRAHLKKSEKKAVLSSNIVMFHKCRFFL